MDGLLKIIWYAAWVIGASAFFIAWLNTAGVLFKAFSALSKAKGDFVKSLKKTDKPGNQSETDAENWGPEKIRRISLLIFFVCLFVLLMINTNNFVID